MKCFPRHLVAFRYIFSPVLFAYTSKYVKGRKTFFMLTQALAVPCCGFPGANPREHNHTVCLAVTRLSLRKDLILQEQHLLEELSRPPAPPGGHCHNHRAALPQIYQIPFPASQVEPPRIIQQAPATIIQQLPQPSPVISQIPPAQPFPVPRSGSIKEDMVEMMLMQNAQMHQIMMQNMMLKALPPTALAQLGGDLQHRPLAVKAERPVVHHHHHYPPPGVFPVPPGSFPSTPPAQQWSSSSAHPV
uniref:DUF4587 domain-containing protein n=1 Tax=Malurus cyaneus samueli TaxID=2593467 RepID=A0A8C5U052_9PASS